MPHCNKFRIASDDYLHRQFVKIDENLLKYRWSLRFAHMCLCLGSFAAPIVSKLLSTFWIWIIILLFSFFVLFFFFPEHSLSVFVFGFRFTYAMDLLFIYVLSWFFSACLFFYRFVTALLEFTVFVQLIPLMAKFMI